MIVFMLALFGAMAQAQMPPPQAFPNLDLQINGIVGAFAQQPDGGVVFGGNFTRVNSAPRANIARLRPNGTLDPDWNPSADGLVYALAVDASGAVYAGGDFSNIGGQSRRGIAKLSGSGTGAADPNWDPSTMCDWCYVDALAVDASGAVYTGGYFSSIGGQPRSNIAKLSGSGVGAADPNWNPSADGPVLALAVGASGAVYAGGGFNSIGGQSRNFIAKLSSGGTGAAAPDWNPSANGFVYALAVGASGAVYAGGDFRNIGGQSRYYIAKLSGSDLGAADSNWNPSADWFVNALVVDAGGAVYAGGSFSSIGGQYRNHIAKLSGNGTGAADLGWNPSANGSVSALAVDASGMVHAGGRFSSIGGQTRWGVAVLNPSGSILGSVADAINAGRVLALARQPDGGLIIGGDFLAANGVQRNNLVRLLPNGSLDPIWNPSANDWVDALAVDASGAVYAGGGFRSIGGYFRDYIAKLSGSGVGAVDPGWNPSADWYVDALAVSDSGAVYVGGRFSNIGGQAHRGIAKLSGSDTGAADPNWDPSICDWCYVDALAVDASGAVYTGGYFSSIGGQPRSNIAKLSGSGVGAADPNWNPSADWAVVTLAVGASGAVYAGGDFTIIGGEYRNYIAKLSGSGVGAVDPDWNPSADGFVNALVVDAGGAVYAGGDFTAIGGQPRGRVAKLSGSGVGAADPGWNPSANDKVGALAVGAHDAIYVGGDFTRIGNVPRMSLAKLLGDLDVIFNAASGGGFEGF